MHITFNFIRLFFKNTNETFTNIDYELGLKGNLNKL